LRRADGFARDETLSPGESDDGSAIELVALAIDCANGKSVRAQFGTRQAKFVCKAISLVNGAFSVLEVMRL
jgi:hypothetical protein